MKILRFGENTFLEELESFAGTALPDPAIRDTVESILEALRTEGDRALLRYTERFDRARLTSEAIRVSAQELQQAYQQLEIPQKQAFEESIAAVQEFYRDTIPQSWEGKNRHGASVGERYDPLTRVGLYIPGGNVPLVSTVIMTAVLAKLAGVPEIAVCTPPDAGGKVNEALLAALHLVGIQEVYRAGGVQAMGALAYGTETIKPVVKLFGPGNAFVMEAKRQLFGHVGVDLLPGPSELMIIADETANPDWIAADLLAQGEHGSGKEKLYLVTWSEEVLEKVKKAIQQQLSALSHAEKLRVILERGTLVALVENEEQAIEVANFIAPEHLEIQVEQSRILTFKENIVTAGALLIGNYTPAAVGDFAAGPSHTLPTNRSGRFLSGLKMSDFYRRTSLLEYSKEALSQAAPVVKAFAEMERLDAHGRSVSIRIEKP